MTSAVMNPTRSAFKSALFVCDVNSGAALQPLYFIVNTLLLMLNWNMHIIKFPQYNSGTGPWTQMYTLRAEQSQYSDNY